MKQNLVVFYYYFFLNKSSGRSQLALAYPLERYQKSCLRYEMFAEGPNLQGSYAWHNSPRLITSDDFS